MQRTETTLPVAEEEMTMDPQDVDNGSSITETEEAVYTGFVDLVARVQTGESDGMEELYSIFARGVRFFVCRQLGPQELDDKVHDIFLLVVQAIRRGDLREPERLMGF